MGNPFGAPGTDGMDSDIYAAKRQLYTDEPRPVLVAV